MGKVFITDCVSSDSESITPMVEKARDITRRTFLKHVDRNNLREITRALHYDDHPKQGLTMAGDWHVGYAKSTFQGRPCVFFIHSAIEYVFC